MLVWAVTVEGGCRASRKQAGACLLSGKCTSGHRCTGAQAAVEGGSRPTAPEPAVVAVVPSSAMSSAATAGEAGICGRQLACTSDGGAAPLLCAPSDVVQQLEEELRPFALILLLDMWI